MRFVLDASVTLAWCFPDETDPYALQVLNLLTTHEVLVPAIWTLEIANALVVGERRNRITRSESERFIALMHASPITVDGSAMQSISDGILSIAREQQVSAYDAAYLEVAMREGLPLASIDGRVRTAMTALGIPAVTLPLP